MENQWDYIIVGAGVLGTATAMYLKTKCKDESILLIDKFPTAGQGNTIKSNAAYRNIFDTDHNISMCQSSVNYYKHIETKGINLGLKEIGYLWLLNDKQFDARNKADLQSSQENISFLNYLKEKNVPIKLYSKKELEKIVPQLQLNFSNDEEYELITPANISHGMLGIQCGSLAPDLLVRHYENEYKKLGGQTLYSTEVSKILLKERDQEFDNDYIPTVWRSAEIGGIQTWNGNTKEKSILQCKHLIIATGAWINQLLDPLGINCGIKPKKRQLFRICGLESLVNNNNFVDGSDSLPFTILPIGGIFFKPLKETGCIDVGCSDDIGRRFETRIRNVGDSLMENTFLDNPKAEIEFFATNILPVLQMYFPQQFPDDVKVLDKSAGMYAYSMDKNPVIETNSKLRNLTFISGASGSGIMKADAIARIAVGSITSQKTIELFGGIQITVADFSLKNRNLVHESLVL